MTSLSSHSLSANPALSVLDTTSRLRCEVQPSHFGLTELQSALVSTSRRISPSFGINARICSFGFSTYRELSAQLAISHVLSDALVCGLSAQYITVRIPDYPGSSIFTLDAGMTFILRPDVRISYALHNANRATSRGSAQTVVQDVQFGVGYSSTPDLHFDCDAIVSLNRSATLRCALCYDVMKQLSERVAFESATRSVESHTSVKLLSDLTLLVMMRMHAELGISMGGGVSLLW